MSGRRITIEMAALVALLALLGALVQQARGEPQAETSGPAGGVNPAQWLAAAPRVELREPLRIGAGEMLRGPLTLVWRGEGPWAVIVGEPDAFIYDAGLEGVRIEGGGLRIQRMGQHCTFADLTISRAPQAGVHIEGVGDGLLLDRVVVRECGEGVRLNAHVTHNNFTFSRCNFQHNAGYGLIAQSFAGGGVYALTVRDSIIQNNASAKSVDSDVWLGGWIGRTVFEHVWIENSAVPISVRLARFQTVAAGKLGWRIPQGFIARDCTFAPFAKLADGRPTVALHSDGQGVDLRGMSTKGAVQLKARAKMEFPLVAEGVALEVTP